MWLFKHKIKSELEKHFTTNPSLISSARSRETDHRSLSGLSFGRVNLMGNPDIFPSLHSLRVAAIGQRSHQLRDHSGVYLMNSGVRSQLSEEGTSLNLLSAALMASDWSRGVIWVEKALKGRTWLSKCLPWGSFTCDDCCLIICFYYFKYLQRYFGTSILWTCEPVST